jgi:hypothetical protein
MWILPEFCASFCHQLREARLCQNHRLQYGREQVEITQKQLADFRREPHPRRCLRNEAEFVEAEDADALSAIEG